MALRTHCSGLGIRSILWFNVFAALILPVHTAPDLASLQSELTSLKDELSRFKTEFLTQERKFADLMSSVVSTQSRTTTDLSRLKHDVTSLQGLTNNALTELNDIKVTCNITSSDVNSLQNDVIGIQTKSQTTDAELAVIHRKIDDIQNNVTENRHDIASSFQELSVQNTTLQNMKSADIRTGLIQAQQDITSVQTKEAKLALKLDSLTRNQNLTDQTLTNVSKQLSGMKSDLMSFAKNLSGLSIVSTLEFNAVKSDVQNMKSEVLMLKVEASVHTSQINGLVKDNGLIQGAVSNLSLEVHTMTGGQSNHTGSMSKQELDTVQVVVFKLKSDLDSSEVEVARLGLELMKARNQTIAELRNVTLQVETVKTNTNAINEMMHNFTLQYSTDVSLLHTDISRLKSAIPAVKSNGTLMELELERVSNISNLLKSDLSNINGELQALKVISATNIHGSSNTTGQLEADINRLKMEFQKLYTDVNVLQNDNNGTSAMINVVRSGLQNVKFDVTLAMRKVSSCENDTQVVKTDIQRLKTDTQTVNHEVGKLKPKVTKLEGDLQIQKTNVLNLERTVQQLNAGAGQHQGSCGLTQVTHTPGPCPLKWSHHDGYCFMVMLTPATWVEAGMECMSHGGKLVSLESKHKSDLVQQFLQTEQAAVSWWVGGTDELVEGHWIWIITDELFTYTNWFARTTPTHDDRDCLLIDRCHQYRWSDQSCDTKTPFICEISPQNAQDITKL